MISFNFYCENLHDFEVRFDSYKSSLSQIEKKLVVCPLCLSNVIKKSVSKININSKINNLKKNASYEDQIQKWEILLRDSIDVGEEFFDVVKDLHNNNQKQVVHGKATIQEIYELHEDGIKCIIVPNFVLDDDEKN